MSTLDLSKEWNSRGLLDQARQAFCDALPISILTREQIAFCFDENVPVFFLIIAKRTGEKLTPASFSDGILKLLAEQRCDLQEICMATIANQERPENDILDDFLREFDNNKWQKGEH